MKDFKTNNYEIVIADSEEGLIYNVVNRGTSVVELEDTLLPRAVEVMMDLEDRLLEVVQKYDENQVEDAQADAKSTGSLH